MGNRRIRILAIAPYAEMKPHLEMAAQSRAGQVAVTVCVGDWQDGLQRAKEMLAHQEFDILLSRGGTARLLQKELRRPVAEIPFSILDMLRDIKRFEHSGEHMAVVGVHTVTKNAKVVCDILQIKIPVVEVRPSDDINQIVAALKQDRCTLAICDLISFRAAKRSGLRAIFCSSSVESVQQGIEDAIQFVEANELVYQNNAIYQEALMHDDETVFIYSELRDLVFSSIAKAKDGEFLFDMMRKSPELTVPSNDADFLKVVKGKHYIIKRRVFAYGEERYALLRITERIQAFNAKAYGSYYQAQSDLEEGGTSGSTVFLGEIAKSAEKYAKGTLPIVIFGEEGTGRTHMAKQLYRQSDMARKPLFIVPCAEIRAEDWDRLLQDENSPFSALGMPFFLQNLDALGGRGEESFLQYLTETEFLKRNRIIISMLSKKSYGGKLYRYLLTKGNAVTLVMPSLRERMDVFQSILAFYTSELNQLLGTQIVGFERNAIKWMQQYDWPRNLDQLRHVMRNAFLMTEEAYVSEEHIRYLLQEEEKLRNVSVTLDGNALALHGKTLDEMNYEIVRAILKKEKGNKEKTADRLGIGRTTLWRILKKYEGATNKAGLR